MPYSICSSIWILNKKAAASSVIHRWGFTVLIVCGLLWSPCTAVLLLIGVLDGWLSSIIAARSWHDDACYQHDWLLAAYVIYNKGTCMVYQTFIAQNICMILSFQKKILCMILWCTSLHDDKFLFPERNLAWFSLKFYNNKGPDWKGGISLGNLVI